MKSVLEFLAILCFLAAAIWFGIIRAWPSMLLALGAFFLTLTFTSLINF